MRSNKMPCAVVRSNVRLSGVVRARKGLQVWCERTSPSMGATKCSIRKIAITICNISTKISSGHCKCSVTFWNGILKLLGLVSQPVEHSNHTVPASNLFNPTTLWPRCLTLCVPHYSLVAHVQYAELSIAHACFCLTLKRTQSLSWFDFLCVHFSVGLRVGN